MQWQTCSYTQSPIKAQKQKRQYICKGPVRFKKKKMPEQAIEKEAPQMPLSSFCVGICCRSWGLPLRLTYRKGGTKIIRARGIEATMEAKLSKYSRTGWIYLWTHRDWERLYRAYTSLYPMGPQWREEKWIKEKFLFHTKVWRKIIWVIYL